MRRKATGYIEAIQQYKLDWYQVFLPMLQRNNTHLSGTAPAVLLEIPSNRGGRNPILCYRNLACC